jgi:hypothetical protein
MTFVASYLANSFVSFSRAQAPRDLSGGLTGRISGVFPGVLDSIAEEL